MQATQLCGSDPDAMSEAEARPPVGPLRGSKKARATLSLTTQCGRAGGGNEIELSPIK